MIIQSLAGKRLGALHGGSYSKLAIVYALELLMQLDIMPH